MPPFYAPLLSLFVRGPRLLGKKRPSCKRASPTNLGMVACSAHFPRSLEDPSTSIHIHLRWHGILHCIIRLHWACQNEGRLSSHTHSRYVSVARPLACALDVETTAVPLLGMADEDGLKPPAPPAPPTPPRQAPYWMARSGPAVARPPNTQTVFLSYPVQSRASLGQRRWRQGLPPCPCPAKRPLILRTVLPVQPFLPKLP